MNHLLCLTIGQETAKNINVSQSFMSHSVLWSEWKLFNLFATLEFFSENFLGHLNCRKHRIFIFQLSRQDFGQKSVTWCQNFGQTIYAKNIKQQKSCAHLSSAEKNPNRSFTIVVFLKMFAVMRKVFVFMLLGCQLK